MFALSSIKARCVTALAVATTALVTSHGAVAQQPKKLIVAQSSLSMNFVPMYIAEQAGFFRDEGLTLDITLVGGGPKAMSALISGSAELAIAVLSDGINVHRKGLKDVKAIAALLNGYPSGITVNSAIVKKKGVDLNAPLAERAAALKGLKIGITTPGSFSDFMARQAVTQHGMNPDRDIELVPVGGYDTMLAAFRAGRIDACVCIPPADQLLIQEGAAVDLIEAKRDFAGMRDVPVGIAYTTGTIIGKKRDEIERFMRAIARAEALMARDPTAAERATKAVMSKMSPETFAMMWPVFKPLVATDPEISASGYEKELALQKIVLPPEQSAPVQFEDLVDTSLARAAKAAVGSK
ncbi:ABC transporter substrate-binding protein [Pseudorhodoplanes sp.]|uniref:ABC transporter substrate-binding protein n=1 Tax=Pseudorhodoplanes sp. TaxID=1934341 RepID=UPI002C85ACCC|nr:ABC transporter substrate-binding protein [Pseudorhodoplanes sp.]HWV53033.1 ABC transporter substrate-binding protein [Pseudorhodoplanes sp.]